MSTSVDRFGRYEWPKGKRMAACLSCDFDGPTPYLWRTRGRHLVTVGELEQRRFGARVGISRILDVLRNVAVIGSFFIPGAIVDSYPEAVEKVIDGGHEVGLHGYLHEQVDQLAGAELWESLHRSIIAFERLGVTGSMGYRSPSWEMTRDSWAMLLAAGVKYDSSLMGLDVPYIMEGLVEVPVEWGLDDAIFFRFVPGTPHPPVAVDSVVERWSKEIEAAKHYGTLLVFTVHPWISGRGARALALERFLERYADDGEIWWATAGEIAAYHYTTSSEKTSYQLNPGVL